MAENGHITGFRHDIYGFVPAYFYRREKEKNKAGQIK